MKLEVTYSKDAIKAFRKMPAKTATALRDKIELYADDTTISYNWVKPLVGIEGLRIRQGDYRAVCSVRGDVAIFHVYKVGNRREIYR